MNRKFFWIMTAISLVLGLIWGLTMSPEGQCLAQIAGVVLLIVGFVANVCVQQLMKIDVPLGFEGFVFLFGVAVIGTLFTSWNPAALGLALFLFLVVVISKWLSQ